MNIAGRPIVEQLSLSAVDMEWTESTPGQLAVITMGFKLKDELPESPRKIILGEILLVFPEGFVHDINIETDFEIMNEEFPKAQGNWIDYTQMDRLRITLDPEDSMQQGGYLFNFPVIVPKQVPEYNVWTISMCEALRGGCQTPSDSAVLVTFPVPGFKIGQRHHRMAKKRFGAAGPRGRMGGALVAVCVCLLRSLGLSCNNVH